VYRVTSLLNEKDTFADTSTVDEAILIAKRLSRADGAPRLVREGSRIRVKATNGKASWMAACKPCKGTGYVAGDASSMVVWSMSPPRTACEKCAMLGVIEDNPCQ
jgi:hypothetical protein